MQNDSNSDSQVQVAYRQVRSAIINGALPAGATISQVEISHQLAISRTPVREALRMLQSEGLVEAQHQQRMRVSPIRAAEVDSVYSERILLEALAIAVTAERATLQNKLAIERAFAEMNDASQGTLDEWEAKHKIFHKELTACASPDLQAALAGYADRAERFRRVFMASVPRAMKISEKEHADIANAVIDAVPAMAVRFLANHLARTALTLLSSIEPQFDPIFIRRALNLVCGETDASREPPGRPLKASLKQALAKA